MFNLCGMSYDEAAHGRIFPGEAGRRTYHIGCSQWENGVAQVNRIEIRGRSGAATGIKGLAPHLRWISQIQFTRNKFSHQER